MSDEQTSASVQFPCRNLRSKEMYYAYGQEDADFGISDKQNQILGSKRFSE